MKTNVYVGVLFREDSHFAHRIQEFRRRYDERFLTNPEISMPLLQPFEVDTQDVSAYAELVADECEAFFCGHTTPAQVFTGLDVKERGRKFLMHLHPEEIAEVTYFSDSIYQLSLEYLADPAFKADHLPQRHKNFLTLGRFEDPSSLHEAMSIGAKEFFEPSALLQKSICLYIKHNGQWFQQTALFEFTEPPANFSS
jgi:hypothetical protein